VAHLFASRAGVLPQRRMVLHWDDSYAELDFAAQRSLSSIPTPEFHQARAQDGFTRPRVTELAALRESLHTRYFRVTEADWSGQREPLARELEHFVDCVRTGADPIVNGRRAREAVRVATLVVEAARQHRPQLLSEAA
jgi:predicted dehydrogenase